MIKIVKYCLHTVNLQYLAVIKNQLNRLVRCGLFFIATITIAITTAQNVAIKNTFFDTKQANTTLDQLNQHMNQRQWNNIQDLANAVDTVTDLLAQAKNCNTQANDELNHVISLKEEIASNSKILIQDSDEYKKYVIDKENFYTQIASDCQLFIIKSTDILAKLKQSLDNLNKSALLSRSLSLRKLADIGFAEKTNMTYENFYEASGLEQFSKPIISYYLLMILIVLLLSVLSTFLIRLILKKNKLITGFWYDSVKILRQYIIPLFLLITTTLFCYVVLGSESHQYSLPLLINLLTLYVTSLLVAKLLVTYLKYVYAQNTEVICAAQEAFERFCYTSAILAVDIALLIILFGQEITPVWERLATLFWVTLLGLSVSWFTCAVVRLFLTIRSRLSYYPLTRIFIIMPIIALIITEWLGYHGLVVYFAVNTFISLVIIGIVVAFVKTIQSMIIQLDHNQSRWAQLIRKQLGLKSYHKLPELAVAKAAILVGAIGLLLVWLLEIWGLSSARMALIITALTTKFIFMGLEIHPLAIVSAMLVFSAMIFSGRYLSAHVARHRLQGEKDTQIAMAALISYAVFAAALVIAMLIAGFNMTGLAIVAGALSVGIGLGLQNIVNNFVAGIILLLEKPIKPGDRILIGNSEGFVRKIRVRSTQITTLTKQDVIVPNSDLITQQVTNYTFRDTFTYVILRIGVVYGSDIKLVEQVLLSVAKAHPEVMQESPNNPVVLFKAFGASSLDFEMWCFIYDVNKRSLISSQLNFAIDAAFRKNNISIAFPQQDIRILEWPRSTQSVEVKE